MESEKESTIWYCQQFVGGSYDDDDVDVDSTQSVHHVEAAV